MLKKKVNGFFFIALNNTPNLIFNSQRYAVQSDKFNCCGFASSER